MTEQPDRPEQQVRVVQGTPTDDELAAVVAVISAKTAAAAAGPGAGAAAATRPSTWAAYWRTVRTPLAPGPGAWRTSALPR